MTFWDRATNSMLGLTDEKAKAGIERSPEEQKQLAAMKAKLASYYLILIGLAAVVVVVVILVLA